MTQRAGDGGSGPVRMMRRIRRVEGVETVSMRLLLCGGSRSEKLPGLSWVTGRMLVEGSSLRDWRRIAADSDELGMVLTSFGGLENHGLRLDCLARDWRQGLRWLAELVLESSFPQDRCRWICQQAAAELESLAEQPDVKTGWAFAKQLYHPHAGGRPLQGEAAVLAKMSNRDCASFHTDGLARGGVLSVAGDIDPDEAHRLVEELFGSINDEPLALGSVPAPAGLRVDRQEVETQARDQAQLLMGHLTIPLRHPDYRALEALSVILGSGAGLTGRVPTRIREKEGLAYTAYATATAGSGLDPGRLVVVAATSPDSLERAETCIVEELSRLLEEGIEESELDDARSYLLGREPFRRETARQWASLDAQAAFYGVDLDDPDWLSRGLENLDTASLLAVAREHLSIDNLKTTVGLPAESASEPDGPTGSA